MKKNEWIQKVLSSVLSVTIVATLGPGIAVSSALAENLQGAAGQYSTLDNAKLAAFLEATNVTSLTTLSTGVSDDVISSADLLATDVSAEANKGIYIWLDSAGSTKAYLADADANDNITLSSSASNLFANCTSLVSADLSAFDTLDVVTTSGMFKGCSSLTTLNLSSFDTSNVTDMSEMFSGCAKLTACNVKGFDTSNVKTMASMFNGCASITALDVSGFDTSNVTDMSNMFNGCTKLGSLDVSGFNTAKVTNMANMFQGCANLAELSVGSFNTSNVTDMSGMFKGCSKIACLNLLAFNTAKVTTMASMFQGCSSLTYLDITSFNTTNVLNMSDMFNGCSSLTSLDLGSFNTPNTTNMARLFANCENLVTIWASNNFSTKNVTAYENIFLQCRSIKGGLGCIWWNDYSCANLIDHARIQTYNQYGYFTDVKTKTVDTNASVQLSADSSTVYVWAPSAVSSTLSVQSGSTWHEVTTANASTITKVVFGKNSSGKDFSANKIMLAADASNMFNRPVGDYGWNLSSIEGLSVLDTSNVTNMAGMFKECDDLTSLDLSSFDTSKVTNMASMFEYDSRLTSLNVLKLDTSNVTSMNHMFKNCSHIKFLDLSGFDTSKVRDMAQMFQLDSSLVTLNLSSWNTSRVTTMFAMFNVCSSLKTVYASSKLWSTASAASDSVFGMATSIVGGAGTTYKGDGIAYAKVDGGTSDPGYFTDITCKMQLSADGSTLYAWAPASGCTLNVQEFGTGTWRNMLESGSATITKIVFGKDASGNDYSSNKIKLENSNASMMFYASDGMAKLTAIEGLSALDSAHITNMNSMFAGCPKLSAIDLSSLDTSNVTDMSGLFEGDSALTSLDLSTFITSSVTDMNNMFFNCTKLDSVDLTGIDTSKVTNMNNMFAYCSSLTSLDLSHFNTAKVTNMRGMFMSMSSMRKLDLAAFNTSKVTEMTKMFYQCPALTTICVSGSGWNTDAAATSTQLFYGDENLIGGAGTECDGEDEINVSRATLDAGSVHPGYLTLTGVRCQLGDRGATLYVWAPDANSTTLDVADACYGSWRWYVDSQCGTITRVVFGKDPAGKSYTKNAVKWPASCAGMFAPTSESPFSKWDSLTEIEGLENVDASGCTNASKMFANCSALQALDMTGIRFNHRGNTTDMFAGCSSIVIYVDSCDWIDNVSNPGSYVYVNGGTYDPTKSGFAAVSNGECVATWYDNSDFTGEALSDPAPVAGKNYYAKWAYKTAEVSVEVTSGQASKAYDGQGVTLTATVSNTSKGVSYSGQWTYNGNDINGATELVLNLDGACSDSGSYTYKCWVDKTPEVMGESTPVEVSITKASQDAPDVSKLTVLDPPSANATREITGVDETMEYSTDDGNTYQTIGFGVQKITGIDATTNEVLVRYEGSDNYEASNETAVVIPDFVSVSFDAQSLCANPATIIVRTGGAVTQPTVPTAENYAFAGWFKEAACTNEWDFDTDRVSETTTLYAKWVVSDAYIQAAKDKLQSNYDVYIATLKGYTLSVDKIIDYTTQLIQARTNAFSAIEAAKASTPTAVDNAVTNGSAVMLSIMVNAYKAGAAAEEAELVAYKETATAALTESATSAKAQIEALASLSSSEKTQYLTYCDNLASQAKDIVAIAASTSAVDTARDAGMVNMSEMVSAAKVRNLHCQKLATEDNLTATAVSAYESMAQLKYLSTTEVAAFTAQIKSALADAIAKVEATTSVEDIAVAEESGTNSLSDVLVSATAQNLSNGKESIAKALSAQVQADTAAINGFSALSDEEKSSYASSLDSIFASAQGYLDACESADDLAGIETAAIEDLSKVMASAKEAAQNDLAALKATAKESLESSAESARKAVEEMADLTSGERTACLESISTLLSFYEDSIDSAASTADVSSALSKGQTVLKNAVESAKSGSESNLDEAKALYKALLSDVNDSIAADIQGNENLTSAQKADFATQLTAAKETASNAIEDATSVEEAVNALTSGTASLRSLDDSAWTQAIYSLRDAKTAAITAVKSVYLDVEAQLETIEGLTTHEKLSYISDGIEQVSAAQESIDSKTTLAEVASEQTSASTSLNKLVTTAQAAAQDKHVPEAADFTFAAPEKAKYNGSTAWAATLTATQSDMGQVTLWYSADGESWSKAAPVAAGTYMVKADVALSAYNQAAAGVTSSDWTFTVAKRSVVLTSDSAEKAYDGEALTANRVIASGDGWADGEGATYQISGTQTEVGSSDNPFEYTLSSSTDASNYNIEKVVGTLTVKSTRTVTVTFDANGHGTAPEAQVLTLGTKASEPTISADGWIFGGWFSNKACTKAFDFDNVAPGSDITLYAKWTRALLKVGDTIVSGGNTYTVIKSGEAASQRLVRLTKVNKSSKTVTLSAAVGALGKWYRVVGIAKNVFKGTKVKTLTINSKRLTKAYVKNCLKGSKVTKIVVRVGSKKLNKGYAKKYKKFFTKKNCGKKVTVAASKLA